MVDFSKFEKKVHVIFNDKDLLKQAFVHRSYINENPLLGLWHNERLEFLGDAVLELSVTDYLYKKYPDKTEGDLTSYRASLVNADIISQSAIELGMNEYLLLSKGEAKDVGKARQYILANVFESFVGALYIDRGYEAADKFIGKSLFHKIDEIVEKGLFRDAKSFVQEKAQEHLGVTPSYRVMTEIGPDHDKMFTVGIYFGNDFIGDGSGKSKQEAEQKAAQNAIKIRKWNGE